MRCLFCKENSDSSKSIEHIIPESLGNTTLTLRPGVVCDKCNNYFARKVEKPFLDSGALKNLRFHQGVENKKGRLPVIDALLDNEFSAKLSWFPRAERFPGSLELGLDGIKHIFQTNKKSGLIVPKNFEPPPERIASRFLAKVALEAMAARLTQYPDGLEYLVDETQLDLIRNHARRGQPKNWPIHTRRIYDPNRKIVGENGEPLQTVHESDILLTDAGEWYFILAIFGLELVINYGGPEIEGYKRWLSENNNTSPLYHGKNA